MQEFAGTQREKNGILKCPWKDKSKYMMDWKEKSKCMVDVSMMKWMQQREWISFVKNWEFLHKILQSVRHQINNIK